MRELPPAVKLGLFGAGLAAVLAGSLSLGRATGDVAAAEPAPTPHVEESHAAEPHDTPAVDAGVATGTSLSAGGLRLDVETTSFPPSQATLLDFRVLDEDGSPVTDFDVEQGKRMHLVLVSRDLSRHAHLHPEMDEGGTWTTRLTLAPGSYRAVMDFSTGGERRSLGVDLAAPGELELTALPSPATSVTVDGLRVDLVRDGNRLSFTAFRDDEPVVPEPYLGARGHLVAFRAGDLAYVHVHPSGESGATTSYDAELPGPGRYRLFLELQVDGQVRTAPFTVEVS